MVPARDAGSRFFRVSEGGTILKIDFQGVFYLLHPSTSQGTFLEFGSLPNRLRWPFGPS